MTKEEFAEDFVTQLNKLSLEAVEKLEGASNEFRRSNLDLDSFTLSTATQDDDYLSILMLGNFLRTEDPSNLNIRSFDLSNMDDLSAETLEGTFETSKRKILDILNDTPIEEQEYFVTGLSLRQIATYIRWGYMLMQSRCALVSEYLRKIQTEARLA